jgi:GTP-binding protein
MNPVVAIIGRPNVGKSTFFNRLIGRRDALVDNMPGVTRDRHYGEVLWEDCVFSLVDTGGFISGDDDPFSGHIRGQVEQAVEEADVVVLLLDGKYGLSPYDQDLIQRLRRLDKPVFYVVNKIDGLEHEEKLFEFYRLGLDRLFSLSAEHGYGVPDFLDALVAELPGSGRQAQRADEIRIALVGRPNVGKSSLINRLLGEERLVVSEVAGTTRDAIDTLCQRQDRIYRLIDTAGIRRKSKVDLRVEKLSIIKSLSSMERCDVALIVLDAGQGVTEQDIKVAGYAHERNCGVIFVANKWDLVDKRTTTIRKFEQQLLDSAKFLHHVPVLTVSAITGLRMNRLFPVINQVFDQYITRIGTGPLNRIISDAVLRNEPPMHKGKRLKFYYTTQISNRPPTFVSFVNYPEAVHFSYERFLINQIRADAGLNLTPLRLYFRLRTGKIDFQGREKKRRRKKH